MNSSGWNFDTPDSRPWKLDINIDGTATINTYQDVQPIIERNKLNLNNYGDKLTFGKASAMGGLTTRRRNQRAMSAPQFFDLHSSVA